MRRLACLCAIALTALAPSVVACQNNSNADGADYCAELSACCTTIADATVDTACVQVSQTGNAGACQMELAELQEAGTC